MTKTMKTDTLPLDCADGLDMYIGFEEYGGIATGILQLQIGDNTVDILMRSPGTAEQIIAALTEIHSVLQQVNEDGIELHDVILKSSMAGEYQGLLTGELTVEEILGDA